MQQHAPAQCPLWSSSRAMPGGISAASTWLRAAGDGVNPAGCAVATGVSSSRAAGHVRPVVEVPVAGTSSQSCTTAPQLWRIANHNGPGASGNCPRSTNSSQCVPGSAPAGLAAAAAHHPHVLCDPLAMAVIGRSDRRCFSRHCPAYFGHWLSALKAYRHGHALPVGLLCGNRPLAPADCARKATRPSALTARRTGGANDANKHISPL